MGIDKSNVRYVIHTGMPKSIENYQQESGRAGRDGLEAECSMFYSGSDYGIWKSIMRDLPPEAKNNALDKLNTIYSFCNSTECRHKALVNYFSQDFDKDDCQACDICLGELEYMNDSQIVAQKIMSCVLRLKQMYGATHTTQVLLGSKEEKILEAEHDKLSTYGLLKEQSKSSIMTWIAQLISQGFMVKSAEYQQLQVTAAGWQVLKGEKTARLTKPAETAKQPKLKKSQVASKSWEGVDRDLFELLRKLRSELAQERSVPAYIIFGDAVLRDLARTRPSSHKNMLQVKGIGEQKSTQYGNVILPIIERHCKDNGIEMDVDLQ